MDLVLDHVTYDSVKARQHSYSYSGINLTSE